MRFLHHFIRTESAFVNSVRVQCMHETLKLQSADPVLKTRLWLCSEDWWMDCIYIRYKLSKIVVMGIYLYDALTSLRNPHIVPILWDDRGFLLYFIDIRTNIYPVLYYPFVPSHVSFPLACPASFQVYVFVIVSVQATAVPSGQIAHRCPASLLWMCVHAGIEHWAPTC